MLFVVVTLFWGPITPLQQVTNNNIYYRPMNPSIKYKLEVSAAVLRTPKSAAVILSGTQISGLNVIPVLIVLVYGTQREAEISLLR